jgi:hypothetical protein
MQSYWSAADRARRQAIIIKLQERIRRIRTDIQLEEDRKKSAIEDYDRTIAEQTEELEFTLTLLHEFGAREEDAYTYESSEEEAVVLVPSQVTIPRQQQVEVQMLPTLRPIQGVGTTRVTSAERQEPKEKARAWHIDRTRAKGKKK